MARKPSKNQMTGKLVQMDTSWGTFTVIVVKHTKLLTRVFGCIHGKWDWDVFHTEDIQTYRVLTSEEFNELCHQQLIW